MALPIFFILSAYGITKSELYKPVAQFGAFFKKRMLKLLKPLWMVNLFTIMAYALIGADGYTAEALAKARVNPLFCEIGSHGLPWWEYPLLLVGIKEIDGVVWFVEVTLYAYLAFFVSKSVFPIREKRRSFVCLYTALIVAFGIVAYALALPAHYYRNLWSLVLGLLLAVYERELLGNRNALALVVAACVAYIAAQCVAFHEYLYFPSAVAAIFAIFLCGRCMARRTVRPGSALAQLAAMSYMVYLLHVKLLAIEWHYLGYVSVLLPLAATLALAWVYNAVAGAMAGSVLRG